MENPVRRKGWGLAREAYFDPSIFESEIKNIFSANWILAGHRSDIPRHGDYLTLEVPNLSLVVINNGDKIVAYHNVCRHKGCLLVREAAGNIRKIVCPYHAWTYELDGRLSSARGLPEGVATAELSLTSCVTRDCGGFIFVNPGGSGADWESVKTAFESYFSFFDSEKFSPATVERFIVQANWKVLVENFEECYHCSSIHPEYSSVVAHALAESTCSTEAHSDFEDVFVEFQALATSFGHPSGLMENAHSSAAWAGRFPLRRGLQSQTKDGKAVGQVKGHWKGPDGGISSMRVRPVSYLLGPQDYLVAITFIPVSQQETEVKVRWYWSEGKNTDAEKIEALKWFWRVTVRQDNEISERTQTGMRSIFYKPGPLSVSEDFVESFLAWYESHVTGAGGS